MYNNKKNKTCSEWFKDHEPLFYSIALNDNIDDQIHIFEWKKPNTSIYSIKYIIRNNYLFVSGDLGCAVYKFSSNVEWHSIASMGSLAEKIIKHGLGVVMNGIYDRKPVSDPHILIAGIGDSTCDFAPVQVTQFEADVKAITSQVEKIYLEGNGGGNNGESYPMLWYFAAHKTKCDAITKRKRKGYLFTVGDENPLSVISKNEIKKIFGDDVQEDINISDLLAVVQKNWEIFHIVVRTYATEKQDAINNWRKVLGQRVIVVPNEDHLAEVIVSTIQVIEGEDASKVANSWDGNTALVVKDAIKGLDKKPKENEEVVRL